MSSTDWAEVLFLVGTIPFVFAGAAHALVAISDVWRPHFFTPRDRSVREGMQRSGLGLTNRTTMWRAWLGFNISHGLGLVSLGLVLLLIALDRPALLSELEFLAPLALATSISYLLLSVRFWFFVSTGAMVFGTACFLASNVLLTV